LPIMKLESDPAYQRSMSSRSSQSLIRKIALNFSWSRFQVLTVTPKPSEGWTVPGWLIIDGQHRAAAALLRGDIAELPCIVLDLPDRAAQAQAFVALNRDRVAISRTQMFHAALAAGDPDAGKLAAVCEAAGVQIVRGAIPKAIIKPHQTMAVTTLEKILRERGANHLEETLRIMRQAWTTKPGLGADLIEGVSVFIGMFQGRFNHDHFIAALQLRKPDAWIEQARRRKYADQIRIARAFALCFAAAYNGRAGAELPKLTEAANADA